MLAASLEGCWLWHLYILQFRHTLVGWRKGCWGWCYWIEMGLGSKHLTAQLTFLVWKDRYGQLLATTIIAEKTKFPAISKQKRKHQNYLFPLKRKQAFYWPLPSEIFLHSRVLRFFLISHKQIPVSFKILSDFSTNLFSGKQPVLFI